MGSGQKRPQQQLGPGEGSHGEDYANEHQLQQRDAMAELENNAKRPKLEQGAAGEDDSDGLASVQQFQDELDQINDEANEQIVLLEQEYNKRRTPVFLQRSMAIKQIPHFWQRSLQNHPTLSNLISRDDSRVLQYLEDVLVEDYEDIKSGYKITFTFHRNPYFTDRCITRSLTYGDDSALNISTTKPAWQVSACQSLEAGENPVPDSFTFMKSFVEEDEYDPGVHDEFSDLIKEDLWRNPLPYFLANFRDLAVESDADHHEDSDDDGACRLGPLGSNSHLPQDDPLDDSDSEREQESGSTG